MHIEYKSQKAFTTGIDGRSVTGIFAVHGNVDDGDGWSSRDRTHPGVFGDFKDRGRARAVFLWQHNSSLPPIAAIDDLYEVGRADLPDAVRAYAPDATGGVAVKRTYLETPRADEVLAGLKGGAITEMSYAYEVTRWDMEKPAEGAAGGLPIRNIYGATLFDVSDVNWGMNPATSAEGSKGAPLHIEQQTVRAAVASYTTRLEGLHSLRAKEGRRFSAASIKEIEQTIADLTAAAERLASLIATSDDGGKSAGRRTQDAYQEWQALQGRLRRLGIGG